MQITNQIVLLSTLNEAQIDQAFHVYVESFFDMLSKTITKDKQKLHAIFKACFDYSQVYVYLHEGRVVGFLGWAKMGSHALKPNRNVLQKHLGALPGAVVHWALNYYQPKAESETQAIIEYLAVDPDARGKGIGAKLIQHLCNSLAYRSYTLETTAENTSAVRLYTKMGFSRLPKKLSPLVRVFARVCDLGTPILMKLELP